jgi:hypothetical protein
MASQDRWETDEDRKIYQLLIHRNLIGWIIKELKKEGIKTERTAGDDPNGDILIINSKDEARVKEIVNKIHERFNRSYLL